MTNSCCKGWQGLRRSPPEHSPLWKSQMDISNCVGEPRCSAKLFLALAGLFLTTIPMTASCQTNTNQTGRPSVQVQVGDQSIKLVA